MLKPGQEEDQFLHGRWLDGQQTVWRLGSCQLALGQRSAW